MNCQYCRSKIFENDRVCPQCGAPNERSIVEKQKFITYGSLIKDIEAGAILDWNKIFIENRTINNPFTCK